MKMYRLNQVPHYVSPVSITVFVSPFYLMLQEMDAWYKTKFQDLNTASTRHVESVRGIREEVVSYKKDVSTLLCICLFLTFILKSTVSFKPHSVCP